MKPISILTSFICLVGIILCCSFVTNNNFGIVQDVFSLTNQFRRSKGLPALTLRADLNAIAEKHSIDMAAKRVGFGHGGFEKRNALARKSIKPMSTFAENVAYGATSGSGVVNMWKSSPGHRRNMLGNFNYVGVGIAKDKKGRIFYTQVFAR
ncbi:MAG: CAP domain-containing protein [Ferruginibacter sp.]|nr:CAP domain-containing protein [Ferruginibacter sp.]